MEFTQHTFTFWIFLILSVAAILGGLTVVMSRRPMRCAVGLLVTLLSLAGVYVLMHAHLVAILQVLVYAGGITVLFGFVIMFLKQGGPQRYRGPFMPVWVVSLFTVGYLVYLILPVVRTAEKVKEAVPAGYGTIQFIGKVLLSSQLVPFEAVAILLLMTMVGIIALARRPRKEAAS
jgi:NADH-quinone oxidoreductase subunit J